MSTANCQLPTANSGTEELPVVVYSAESAMVSPIKLIREIARDLWRSRQLTWMLFVRDTKASHRQSVLGFLWMFIPVLSTTLVWTFLSSARVIRVAETPVPYAIHVMVGSMIWTLFVSSLNQPLASFNAGQSVFMKLKVPPEAFILSGLMAIFADLIIRLLILIPVLFWFGVVPPSTVWLFPLGLLATCLFGAAIGMIMIPLGSLYGDVPRIFGTAVSLGMYVTPIIFPVPETGLASTLVRLNPMTSMVMVTRDWLTLGHSEYLPVFLVLTGVSIIVLLSSIIALRIALPHLVERMGM
jgi:lipopolysaccharide transport system permease protein